MSEHVAGRSAVATALCAVNGASPKRITPHRGVATTLIRYRVRRAENSRHENQQHKHSKEQQMNAALQNIRLSAAKRNHAHSQR